MVDLLERLEILLDLEGVAYRTMDYLNPVHQQRLVSAGSSFCDLQSSFSPCSSGSSHSGINEVWREKICEWSYQVIDHFDFSREVVSVAIHFLDRFLSKTQVNKKVFQLVAMTALYLAIKINEPGTLGMTSMIELSRGYFSPVQMAEMEMAILRALDWRLHPPTPYCFCKHTLFLLPQGHVSVEARYEILELARFYTELSVIDYFFVVHRASDIALAALLNAIETVSGSSEMALVEFQQELRRVNGGLDPDTPEVDECRTRLHVLYSQGGYSRPEFSGQETRNETISPVCVSYGVSFESPYPSNQSNNLPVALPSEDIDSSNEKEIELEFDVDAANQLFRSATLQNLHYDNGEENQIPQENKH